MGKKVTGNQMHLSLCGIIFLRRKHKAKVKCCDVENVEKGIPGVGSINSRAERSPGVPKGKWLKSSGWGRGNSIVQNPFVTMCFCHTQLVYRPGDQDTYNLEETIF